jgi:hypothetical protein
VRLTRYSSIPPQGFQGAETLAGVWGRPPEIPYEVGGRDTGYVIRDRSTTQQAAELWGVRRGFAPPPVPSVGSVQALSPAEGPRERASTSNTF